MNFLEEMSFYCLLILSMDEAHLSLEYQTSIEDQDTNVTFLLMLQKKQSDKTKLISCNYTSKDLNSLSN